MPCRTEAGSLPRLAILSTRSISHATADKAVKLITSAPAKYSPVLQMSRGVPVAKDIAMPANPVRMMAPARMDARACANLVGQSGLVSSISRRRIKLGRMRRMPIKGGNVKSKDASTAIPMPWAAVTKSQCAVGSNSK